MRNKIKKTISHPLIAGSVLLIAGGLATNVFNFLFNLFMSRNLRIEDYGTLVSLISIITLLSIPAGAVTPTIVTLAGNYFAQEDISKVHSLYHKIVRPLILIGLLLIVIATFFAKNVSIFLNITDQSLLVTTAIAILFAYIFTANLSFVQAKLSFKFLTTLNLSSAISKVIFGSLFVLTGFGLGGAAFAYLLSFIVPVIIGTIYLKHIIFNKSDSISHISYGELVRFGVPSALVIFCLNAFISTDILLVKHLFSQKDAGLYAGLSLVGRVVFYLTAPVTTVMFPMIINRFNSGQSYKNILYLALSIVSVISIAATTFYFIFPKFTIIFFLKKTEYLTVSHNLGMFGIFATLFAIISILSYYFLAIKQTKIALLLFVGVVVQALLITFYHSDFGSVINVSIFVMSALLAGLCIFFKFTSAKN